MALLWILLYFWFFSSGLQAFIMLTDYSGTTGLRDSLLYSSLWLIPVFLFPHTTRLIAAVIGVILWLRSAAALAYFVIYGQAFPQSVLFVMFETNGDEAHEFASQYFSLKLFIILLLYTAVALFFWMRLRPVYIRMPWRYGVAAAIFYGLLQPLFKGMAINKRSVASAVDSLNSRMELAAPWQLVSSYVQYRNHLNSHSLESLFSKNSALPPLAELKDSSDNAPRTLVLVIGESTQRNRMSLNGYPRETTPGLDALRNSDPNFTVFNDVVTSHPYTI